MDKETRFRAAFAFETLAKLFAYLEVVREWSVFTDDDLHPDPKRKDDYPIVLK